MQHIGDRKQFWSGPTFLCIGAFALWNLPPQIGTLTNMGAGYFPMLVAAGLVLFGGASMVLAIRSIEQMLVGQLPWVALFFVIGGVFIFAALITQVGLAISLLCLVVMISYGRVREHPLEVLIIYLGRWLRLGLWGVIASMRIGNIMLLVLNLPMIGIWIRLLLIPFRMLYPAILAFCCIGVFSVTNAAFDVMPAGIFGFAGVAFKMMNCSPAPLILALVLEPLLEEIFGGRC